MKKFALTGIMIYVLSVGYSTASVMEEVFIKTSSLQTNRPTSINTPTRNGLSLGGAQFRVKQIHQAPISFSPPRLSAGCGGIDFYAGAFSTINSDQLVQMGRAIAQGVPGYAFNLAMTSVCPSCTSVMDALQSKLDQFNELTANGCEAAGDFLSNTFKSEAQFVGDAINIGALEGYAKTSAGWINDFGQAKAEQGDTDNIAEKSKKLGVKVQVNSASSALDAAKVAEWSHSELAGLSRENLKNLIMSLTGTFISKATGDTSKTETGMKTEFINPTFTLKDLFDGTYDNKLKVMSCIDIACLQPKFSDVRHMGLVDAYKKEAYNGIEKLLTRSAVPLTAEQKSVEMLSGINFQVASKYFAGGDIDLAAKVISNSAAKKVLDSFANELERMIPVIQGRMKTDDQFQTGIMNQYKDRLDTLMLEIKERKMEHENRLKAEETVFALLNSVKESD